MFGIPLEVFFLLLLLAPLVFWVNSFAFNGIMYACFSRKPLHGFKAHVLQGFLGNIIAVVFCAAVGVVIGLGAGTEAEFNSAIAGFEALWRCTMLGFLIYGIVITRRDTPAVPEDTTKTFLASQG